MKRDYDIIWHECVDSTNNEARRRISEIDNLSVIAAMSQTKGRGQGDHVWLSEPGANLLFSIVLKFQRTDCSEQFVMNQITSQSVVDLLATYGIKARIKWPNDIYVEDKKICGMLIENMVQGKLLRSSIIGIGLNVNQRNFDVNLPNPTSMAILTSQEYVIQEVLYSFLKIFIQNIERHFRKF